MTLQIRSERDRQVAREKLAEVVAKLEEALHLQSQLDGRAFSDSIDRTAKGGDDDG